MRVALGLVLLSFFVTIVSTHCALVLSQRFLFSTRQEGGKWSVALGFVLSSFFCYNCSIHCALVLSQRFLFSTRQEGEKWSAALLTYSIT